MKRADLIYLILFTTASVILIITYVFPKSLTEIASKGVFQAVDPHTIAKKPTAEEIAFIGTSETVGNDSVQFDYYIIVESLRNFTQAKLIAEKLFNDFNANIIILPPTAEGYCRISYGKYSTLKDAKSAIKKIRENISSNAWIFSVKK
jgi:hypothetical protein